MNQLSLIGKSLLSLLGGLLISAGSLFTPAKLPTLGNATQPIAGVNYTLSGSGISAADTSITLTSLTLPQTGRLITTADLSTNFYVTLEAGSNTKQEIASCTTVTQNVNLTATLSGCTRGLLPVPPYTASTTYAFPHGGGTKLIFSNAPQLYNEFAAIGNSETITGDWHFPAPVTTSSAINKDYADRLTLAGAPVASEIVAGLTMLVNQVQLSSGTATSTYGTTTYFLVPKNQYFNATSSATTTVPVTGVSGKLSQGFLNLANQFTFTGGVSSTGATALSGSVTISATTSITANVSVTGTSTLATTTFTGAVNGTIWQELANVTLAAPAGNITTPTFPAKTSLLIYIFATNGTAGTTDLDLQFNGDASAKYADRYSLNGAGDASHANGNFVILNPTLLVSSSTLTVVHVNNVLNFPKSMEVQSSNFSSSTAGAGIPDKLDGVGMWYSTSSITSAKVSIASGNFPIGSQIIVYGSPN